jgi:glucose/arabinose dehydrogenase
MKRPTSIACLLVLALGAGCGGGDGASDGSRQPAPPARTETAPDTGGDRLARSDGEPRVETIATGLAVPWELAFLPDGRALITERPGTVRLLSRRLKLQAEPLARVDRVEELGEGGLLGLAVDPDFERNRFVYMYRTTADGNEVARFRFQDGRLEEERVVADGIQAAGIHDGGRLRFGPDGRLYFSTGDAASDELAQDQGSLNGKILRLDPDQFRGAGGRPEVFSLGHRNPQGFDWQPRTGRLVEDEHGPDGDDEVNFLRKGANYGWPDLRGEQTREGFTAPVAVYRESIAPSGSTFVRLPGSEWTGDYLIGCLVGEQIRRIGVGDDGVTTNEALFEGDFGRLRTVVEGPDGALYVLTNNTDGRGTPREGDDRLLRIVPPAS